MFENVGGQNTCSRGDKEREGFCVGIVCMVIVVIHILYGLKPLNWVF